MNKLEKNFGIESGKSENKRVEKLTEESLDPKTIGLATTTLYPKYGEGDPNSVDNVRGRLGLGFLKKALEDGYRVVMVVDGQSSDAWKKELQNFTTQRLILEEQIEPGLSAGRQQAMESASKISGVKVVAETEFEKVDIEKQVKKLALPVLNGEAVVVIANRGEQGMENYPTAQKKEEQKSNDRANAIVKKRGLLPENAPPLDWWNGTRFIKNDPEILICTP